MTVRVLRRAGFALVVAVFALLSLARGARAQLLSPGPLSKAHTSLEGDTHCVDCHSSGKRVDQGACLKCHSDLGARIAAGLGLHGLQYKGRPCEGCHVEHLGLNASLEPWPGGGQASFNHVIEGWALEGAHKTTACNKCHNKPNARGNPTFLNLSRTCTSCHKDEHNGRFGATCTSCHDAVSWKDLSLQAFNHDLARFQLRGAHRTVPCAKCHSDPPKFTGLSFFLCGDCHKDPHESRLGTQCTDCHDESRWKPVSFFQTRGKHPGVSLANGHASVACQACHDKGNLVAPSKGTECVSCHKPVHDAPFGRGCATCHASIEWLGLARSVGIAAHPRTDFPLTGKHVDVSCASCHKPDKPEDVRFRKLAFKRCEDCHSDVHKREFAAADNGECAGCHTTSGFRPTLFGPQSHASTRFPLEGRHQAAPCSSCHTSPRPRLDLRVAKQACADCHQNPHGDQFATEMAQGGCAHCHDARAWGQPKIDHSTWPLTGAHAGVQCDSCHHPTPEDRKAGAGPSYQGVPRGCAGCHDDVHLGQFRLTDPMLECSKCHSTKAFKIEKFDHLALAGWALTGAHATTPCAKCHAMTRLNGERPTERWRGLSTDCKFCHASPHERRTEVHAAGPARPHGLFAVAVSAPADSAPSAPSASAAVPAPSSSPAPAAASAAPPVSAPAAAPSGSPGTTRPRGITDTIPCDACHSTTGWKAKDASGGANVTFDHSTTGFPLVGQHIHTPCVSCHNSTTTLKRACVSCHEDFHRGRLAQGCDTCHVPAGWRVTRPLEIHRRTRFPLTGMHTLADCTQCHLRASEQKFTDAPVQCYGCHEQDYRQPGIFPVHVGTATTPPLPRDCSICHRAIAWVPANIPASLIGTFGTTTQAQQVAPRDHEVRFPISFGVHRMASCQDCHASQAAPRAVRCIGCHEHDPVVLLQQHRQAIAMDGASCMSCHPGGVRR